MNEEEAELLPPYLRPYPPAGAPLGTLSYNRRGKGKGDHHRQIREAEKVEEGTEQLPTRLRK